jgi:hypothetical protein
MRKSERERALRLKKTKPRRDTSAGWIRISAVRTGSFFLLPRDIKGFFFNGFLNTLSLLLQNRPSSRRVINRCYSIIEIVEY